MTLFPNKFRTPRSASTFVFERIPLLFATLAGIRRGQTYSSLLLFSPLSNSGTSEIQSLPFKAILTSIVSYPTQIFLFNCANDYVNLENTCLATWEYSETVTHLAVGSTDASLKVLAEDEDVSQRFIPHLGPIWVCSSPPYTLGTSLLILM